MRIQIVLIGLFITLGVSAAKPKKLTRSEYINVYKDLAMSEMSRTGIPASITLAQGILESGDGNSSLAQKSNNHFGIKCHDWTGPSVKHDDDRRNECFRKYKDPEQSYIDHSDFLTQKSRYASLFELPADDYKGWAKGLKKAGYATSPTYAKALIGIIEDNNLSQYDEIVIAGKKEEKKNVSVAKVGTNRKVFYNNRVKYIVAKEGDTYTKLTDELSLFDWQLPKYNEVSLLDTLRAGDKVYLQPKRNRGYGKYKTHLVNAGESLHSISQQYGIKEEKLRLKNNIALQAEPAPGVVLLLKGKNKSESIPVLSPVKQKEKEQEPQTETDKDGFVIEYDLGG